MSITRRDFLRLSLLGVGGTFLSAFKAHDHSQLMGIPAPGMSVNANVTPTQTSLELPWLGFDSFAETVSTHNDDRYLYVESEGIPDHPMMIGIQSWQQQVPLPQFYFGENAWRVPLNPALADEPLSARTSLYRGAIALAINGVPIFNALNNRGDDAFLSGELDEWGGHAGRADDYHYHVAPLHLQEIVGPDIPIAYALDGFPIYGSTEPDGSALAELDEFNGHFDSHGNYHYHGTDTYPYINGGLRGIVEVRGDQIEPQPRTEPIRPHLQPLHGAAITGFQSLGNAAYSLAYQLNAQTYYVNYQITGDTYTFEFVDPSGSKTTETYTRLGR